ncbi:MAG TPA: hypothetical protein VF800_20520 [Telluria sp.]
MLTINEVIDRLDEFNGKQVEIGGILNFEFENASLEHYPKAEHRDASDDRAQPYYPSSIWLAFGSGSIQPNMKALMRWNGKRVRVTGIMAAAEAPFGCGHFSAWGCEIMPYTIERI